jgi:purine-nucleoside phosphorylase
MCVPTAHNVAAAGDFAPTVLMPGDPLRSRFIAETYLSDAKLVNDVRGVQGYTGLYHGKRVSVMASGMGMPSIGIYSYELFHFYPVETIIRIGSAGAVAPGLHLRDLVIGVGACTDSNYAAQFGLPGAFAPIADFELAGRAYETAQKMGLRAAAGNLLSSDRFYDDGNTLAVWRKMGVLAVEMESAALYMNAARAGKKALCICTISDRPLEGGEVCSAQERQTAFTKMIELALEIA